MTYCNDFDAALARQDVLVSELAEACRQRDAARSRCRALEHRTASAHGNFPSRVEAGELSTWWILLSVLWLGALIAAIRNGLS